MRKFYILSLLLLLTLTAQAQLSGTGYYRFRNADREADYISMANDKFNYHTVISTACGGLGQATSSAGQARAMECAGKYLETDIHMVADAECIDPGSVVYAQKKSTSATNYDYNLIGQGTSLLTLTTGTYDGSVDLEFNDRYVTIEKKTGSGAETLYTAKIELKSATSVIFYGQPSLGIRYLVDDGGKLAINESSSAQNAKWYIEPVSYFNVKADVEFGGKFYTTMYVPFAYTLSNNVLKAYVVESIEADGSVSVKEIAANGGTVPAGTPVLLECSSNVASECRLIPTGKPLFTAPNQSVTTGGAPAASTETNYTGTNLLKGNYYCNTDGTITFSTNGGTSSFNANHYTTRTASMYVVGITASGKLGFVKPDNTVTAMPANKAWIEYTGAAELVLPFEEAAFVLGDVNRDRKVTIADVTALVNIILGKATEGDSNNYDFKAANVNEDDDITIADVTALVNMILRK